MSTILQHIQPTHNSIQTFAICCKATQILNMKPLYKILPLRIIFLKNTEFVQEIHAQAHFMERTPINAEANVRITKDACLHTHLNCTVLPQHLSSRQGTK